jgi:hypothetical protein
MRRRECVEPRVYLGLAHVLKFHRAAVRAGEFDTLLRSSFHISEQQFQVARAAVRGFLETMADQAFRVCLAGSGVDLYEKLARRFAKFLRNIEKGKKEKKSWYQYVFLGIAPENEPQTKGRKGSL